MGSSQKAAQVKRPFRSSKWVLVFMVKGKQRGGQQRGAHPFRRRFRSCVLDGRVCVLSAEVLGCFVTTFLPPQVGDGYRFDCIAAFPVHMTQKEKNVWLT